VSQSVKNYRHFTGAFSKYLPGQVTEKWCRWIDTLHKTVTNGSWSEIREALRIVIVQ